ncbi:MAG: hypothetical protein KJO00_10040, partial [Bacteroidia bacterium]|nr:hypothetical protein [Bacteroidia bacterium]
NTGYEAAIEQIIMKISPESDENFFDKTILAGNSGMVIAKVKDSNIEDYLYYYDILFSVKPKKGDKLFFQIDPILKGNN